jgi:MscS family membrane protein
VALFQEKAFLQKSFPTSGLAQTVSKLVSVVIFLFSILMILRLLQLDIVPLLAFGGIGAAALGFAAKDVMGNFFGGIMLSITQPFVSGDQIFLPMQDVEGEVEEIGWYLTCIRDREKRPLYFPNALFSQGLVVNLSRMTHRRIKETVRLRFQDSNQVEGFTKNLRNLLRKHPQIDASLPVLLSFEHIGEYSLEIYLEVYTLEKEFEGYLQVKEEILFNILSLLKKEGLELAYPVSLCAAD